MVVTYQTPTTSVPLHRGPSGLPPGAVTENQRGRVLAAVVQLVGEAGYARLTVAEIIRRARVSRKTFYLTFRDREDCFLAAFDIAVAGARDAAEQGFLSRDSWSQRMRGGLGGVLAFFDAEPDLAKLCVVESLGAGPGVLARRAELLDQLAAVVDQGRSEARVKPPALAAEGAVGAVLGVLYGRLLRGHREPLSELLGPLMNMLGLLYVGADEASRQLDVATGPPRPWGARPQPENVEGSLDGLDMRLTYRTVRVLMALAERPGASNREIAKRADIADQGQMSKLLTRLARLELITNVGEGQEKGMCNAWHLTDRGGRVERATRLA